MMGSLRCPFCRSRKLVKAGIVKNKQRYLCNNCQRTTIKLDKRDKCEAIKGKA